MTVRPSKTTVQPESLYFRAVFVLKFAIDMRRTVHRGPFAEAGGRNGGAFAVMSEKDAVMGGNDMKTWKTRAFLALFLALVMVLSSAGTTSLLAMTSEGDELEEDGSLVVIADTEDKSKTAGDVTVVDSPGPAVKVYAEGGNTAAAKTEDVTVFSPGPAIAVQAEAHDSGSKTEATVGDVWAITEEGGLQLRSVRANETVAVEASAHDGAATTVNANEANAANDNQGNATAVSNISQGEGSQSTVNVAEDARAYAANGDAHAVKTEADEGTAVTTVKGDAYADSNKGKAAGIRVDASWEDESNGNATVQVTVEGSVTAEGAYDTDGVKINADYGSQVKVTVGQDVSSTNTAEQPNDDDYIYADGVEVVAYDSQVTVDVGGDITSKGNDAYGIYADSYSSNVEVTAGGDVTAAGQYAATGAEAYSVGDGSVKFSVDGSVTANADEGSATAARAYARNGAEAEVTVAGEASATGQGQYVAGVDAEANDAGVATVTVEGGVTMEASNVDYEPDYDEPAAFPAGVFAHADEGGTSDVTVNGDVEASADTMVAGVLAYTTDEGEASVTVNGDVSAALTGEEGMAAGIAAGNSDGIINVQVTGNVTGDTAGIMIEDFSAEGTGETNIKVVGDVTGEQGGLAVMGTEEMSVVNAVIDGTLSGKEESIVLEGGASADNVNLTVWKVDLDKDGNAAVEMGFEDDEPQAATEFEKSIMYIIRLEQPKKGGTLSTAGTTKSNGYDVAHEGETVTLKVNVKKGYKVVAAYNGTNQKVQLVQDAKGDYYIVVPKGGGVTLSVALKLVKQSGNYAPKAAISVDPEGGKVPGRKAGAFTINTHVGSTIKVPNKPTKEGYTFVGWYESLYEKDSPYYTEPDENAEYLKPGKSYKVEGDTNFIAIWKEN